MFSLTQTLHCVACHLLKFLFKYSRQKVQARSAVQFAVELLTGFQVDGTWNVPITLTWVGCFYSLIEIPDPAQEYCESRCDGYERPRHVNGPWPINEEY